jgi:hypothetical protein
MPTWVAAFQLPVQVGQLRLASRKALLARRQVARGPVHGNARLRRTTHDDGRAALDDLLSDLHHPIGAELLRWLSCFSGFCHFAFIA